MLILEPAPWLTLLQYKLQPQRRLCRWNIQLELKQSIAFDKRCIGAIVATERCSGRTPLTDRLHPFLRKTPRYSQVQLQRARQVRYDYNPVGVFLLHYSNAKNSVVRQIEFSLEHHLFGSNVFSKSLVD